MSLVKLKKLNVKVNQLKFKLIFDYLILHHEINTLIFDYIFNSIDEYSCRLEDASSITVNTLFELFERTDRVSMVIKFIATLKYFYKYGKLLLIKIYISVLIK